MAPLVAGTAVLSTRFLPSGNPSLRAFYSGDGSYTPATSAPQSLSVNAQPVTAFSLETPWASTAFGVQSIAKADFNGDGMTDVVMAPPYNTGFDLAFGIGDGTFTPPALVAAGSNLSAVATGDFNGDGMADVAAASAGAGGVYVLLGNGGAFGAAAFFAARPGSRHVVAADFNSDGIPDLATANDVDNSISILTGAGDGTFSAPWSLGADPSPRFLAIADVNEDGKADVVIAHAGNFGLSYFPGNGDGLFGAPVSLNQAGGVWAVATADFNADGHIDLVAIRNDSQASTKNAHVLLGSGGGSFSDPVVVPLSAWPAAVTAGDFDGDGKADFAVVHSAGSSFASVVRGNGDGTFQAPLTLDTFTSGSTPGAIAAGDFNGDGRADFLASSGSSNFTKVILGAAPTDLSVQVTHTGNFYQGQTGATVSIVVTNLGPLPTIGTVSVSPTWTQQALPVVSETGPGWYCLGASCTRHDPLAPGDHYPPLTLTTNVPANAPGSGSVTATVSAVAEANPANDSVTDTIIIVQYQTISFAPLPDRAYTDPPFMLLASASSGLPVAFSATGNCSVNGNLLTMSGQGQCSVTASQSGNALFFAAPNVVRTFNMLPGSASVTLATSPQSLVFGMLTTFTATVTPPSATGLVTFLDGGEILGIRPVTGGTATLQVPILHTGARRFLARYSGDANVGGRDSTLTVRQVTSVPSSGFVSAPDVPGNWWIASGDFNGDGKLDLASGHSGVSIWLGQGDGTFVTGPAYPGVPDPGRLRAADMNGDGFTDLVTSRYILLGNGDGTFGNPIDHPGTGLGLEISDFNRDGKPDVVVASGANWVYVFLGNGDGTLAAPVQYTTGFNADGIQVADFNNDGRVDLAVGNQLYSSNQNLTVLLGLGDGTFGPPVHYSVALGPGILSASDFNQDNNVDLVSANSQRSASVFLGTPNGNFQSPRTYATGELNSPLTLVNDDLDAVDFTGDGADDVLASEAQSSLVAVRLLQGKGDGTLQAAREIPIPPSVGLFDQVVGDFNRDGHVDLAVSRNNTIQILLGAVVPVLSVEQTSQGTFLQGQTGAIITAVVRNQAGAAATNGVMTVTESVPAGMALMSMSGTGWSCPGLFCTRSDTLAPGSSYPPITMQFTVGATAEGSLTNQVAVSGGGAQTAKDLTPVYVQPPASCPIQVLASLTFGTGGGHYSMTVGGAPACIWTAVSWSPWIRPILYASGHGGEGFYFNFDRNLSTSPRVGYIIFRGATVRVDQTGQSTLRQPTAVFRDSFGGIRLGEQGSGVLYSAGGVFASDPGASQSPNGNTFVVARDTFNGLWVNTFSAASKTWGSWSFAGGAVQGVPAIAANDATAYFSARDSGNAYWLRSYSSASGFGAWIPLGGVFATDPVMSVAPDGSVYLIGKDFFNAIWASRYVPGSGFQGWKLGGAVAKGKPSVTVGDDNAALIVIRDNWDATWLGIFDAGDNWSTWQNGGAVTSQDPQIAASDDGRAFVLIRDGQGSTWYQPTQRGWIGGWIPVGGVLNSSSLAVSGEAFYFAGRDPGDNLWWYSSNASSWQFVGYPELAGGGATASPR